MDKLPGLARIPGLRHAISEVSDGNQAFRWGKAEEVRRNREKFLESAAIPPESCVGMAVIHGEEIRPAGPAERGRGIMDPETALECDALVTDHPGTYLFMLTADCLPLILYEPRRRALALAHVSRINALEGFARKAAERLAELGADPADCLAGIGPSVRRESYLFTPDEIEERIPAAARREWATFLLPAKGKVAVDLLGKAKEDLIRAGLREENIEVSPTDTARDPRFFSHYRARNTGEQEGRFATVVGMIQ